MAGFLHAGEFVDLPAAMVRDKILGGLLGHLLGDLNGLKHEMKYIDEPGNVQSYKPSLPEGAWTDDDTDFEWVYIMAMQKDGVTLPPQKDLPELWRQHANGRNDIAVWGAPGRVSRTRYP
jgi:ADP-ribosylglycohydrolase